MTFLKKFGLGTLQLWAVGQTASDEAMCARTVHRATIDAIGAQSRREIQQCRRYYWVRYRYN